MTVKNVYSGSPLEQAVGYCRAKRVGDFIYVSGTVAVDASGRPFAPGDVYLQTRNILDRIDRALWEIGASVRDIVRTRTFLTDITKFDEFARAHHDVFAGIDPVATCVQVARLVAPEFAVEVEVDAIVTT